MAPNIAFTIPGSWLPQHWSSSAQLQVPVWPWAVFSLAVLLAMAAPPRFCLAGLPSYASVRAALLAMGAVTKLHVAPLQPGANCNSRKNSPKEEPVLLQPQCEKGLGVEVMWQIPPTSALKGTLFIAPGWREYPSDFWELPEERAITLAALRRGFAVVAVASAGEFWAKSRPAAANRDMRNVVTVLAEWRKRHGLEKLPLAGLGVSDGGSFLPLLALEMGCFFSALVLMISRGSEEAIQEACQRPHASSFPPTLFVEMPADEATSRAVGKHVAALREAGIEAARLQCHPLRMHHSFFAERIPGLDATTSARLVRALQERKHVDDRGYFVSPSPQAADWKFVRAWDWAPLVESLGVLARGTWAAAAVAQQLSLAFGFHCPTSLKSLEMLDWLAGKLGATAMNE